MTKRTVRFGLVGAVLAVATVTGCSPFPSAVIWPPGSYTFTKDQLSPGHLPEVVVCVDKTTSLSFSSDYTEADNSPPYFVLDIGGVRYAESPTLPVGPGCGVLEYYPAIHTGIHTLPDTITISVSKNS